ncbi:thymidylate kinase [Ixodes scapularis]|uniref:thymidylate kinase n=1 Tax=Ixodes scapularis TaxID=6945 RepID=UPI001C3907C2|nr:thymidylate kinase [Ixodes scapularis]XP_029825427.3 thymidylate kinase [Ixodes scapularis]
MKSIQRGLFVVFEGCDRTGKTTQIKLLSESLSKLGHKTETIAFPNRSTTTGTLLDSYLKASTDLDDHAVHLLFSANRWEAAPSLLSTLARNTTVIADRYAYSGVAFSAAKSLEFRWCQQCDVGLPEPDLILYMSVPPETLAARGGFGEERYENSSFQEKVRANYNRLASLEAKGGRWIEVDCSKNVQEVHQIIESVVLEALTKERADVGKLWSE